MNSFKNTFRLTVFFFLYSGIAISSISQAQDLYITDDYLQGLSEESDNPEYLSAAKKELRKTEELEQSQIKPAPQIIAAAVDLDSFEFLLREKFPASHSVYLKLSTKIRVDIFKQFRSSRKLSIAKRAIIETYLKQNQ